MTQSPDPDTLRLGPSGGGPLPRTDLGCERMGTDPRPALTEAVSGWGWTPAPR